MSPQRLVRAGAALLVVLVGLLSCRDAGTGPNSRVARFATGIRVNTVFPAFAAAPEFASVLAFTSVRATLTRADGAVALDSTYAFPADSDQINLSLIVRLTPGTPDAGELVTLNLTYLNAAKQVVFSGGPVPVLAVPNDAGRPLPAPVTIAVTYAGPGAAATSVQISPAQLAVNAGAPFLFTAIATDASGATVPGTPVVWKSLDTAHATLAQPTAGAGTAHIQRGTARIVAQLINGAADTVMLTINALPSALTKVSGDSQTVAVDLAAAPFLPQPLVVKVTASDGLPVAGVTVDFAAASENGSVTPASAVTDSSGLAQTAWQLARTVGTQTVTATSAAVPSVVVTFKGIGAATPNGFATTVVTPKVDTLTALTQTRRLGVAGIDRNGAAITGTWSWVSRAPAVVTVDSTGLVAAIANGSTWVVATEAGGTADSAQVTVQQRAATIAVTPATRSLYVSTTLTFSASAVDGLGSPLATQPAFVWSSTQAAVASVNASTGEVSALAAGSTQIRAASGTAVGVANVTVLSPITRIDVMRDTVNAVAPDTFTMTALGQIRVYRAVALDTLLNPMAGVTFSWSSSNPSVAVIDSTTATQAEARAAANGITSIRATAQGVTGSASLMVAQVLAVVELTPASVTVAPGGSTSLIARGKDGNGFYISGGVFSYSSSNPGIASVDANTGRVTGVTNGTTNITATSGNFVSNVATVTVSGAAAAIISFGRDTLGVGRGTQISIPILLSKPDNADVVIALAARDTVAYWSTSSVTIPAGQTSVNAILNGRNAGTTLVYATNTSGNGYVPDTAVVAVQANLRMATSFYSLNATDEIETQVLLSDPSPAGGTYAAFSYGTAGIAQTSPDPAFIPAGQLAADVVVRGLAAGSTTVTPSAIGVAGAAANVTVSAPTLTFYYTTLRLGAGQSDPNGYVYLPNYVAKPFTISLSSTDSTIASASPTVTVPGGSYYAYVPIAGRRVGTAKIIASVAGWKSDTIDVTVTSPSLAVCCGGNLVSTSPATSVTVYTADSTQNVHNRINSLAVRVSSTDSSVMKVLDTLVTIDAGTSYSSAARTVPGGAGGSAYIKVTASGHRPDSVLYTVEGPALSFNYSTSRVGEGQFQDVYVSVPNYLTVPLVVRLTNSDSTYMAAPDSVVIPSGTYLVFFTQRGRAPGVSTLIASAAGYKPDTAVTTVTTPRVVIGGDRTMPVYSTSTENAMVADSVGNVHNRITPLTVTLVSTDTNVIKVDSVQNIAGGVYYASPAAVVTAVNAGTAKIIATAPGHLPDTNTWTVQPAKLNITFTTYMIGARQHTGASDFYVHTPSVRDVAVPITLTHSNASVTALSAATVTVPANSYYQYFSFAGLAPGKDTIIASASGYLPDTAYVTVTSPKLITNNMPSTATTTSPQADAYVYTADSLGNTHYSSDTLVVHAVSSNANVMQPAATDFRILKDAYYAVSRVLFTGAGTASITFSDSAGTGYAPVTSSTVTVTGPALTIVGSNPGRLGMRQTAINTYYVQIPNALATPVTVNLLSTDPRVATVTASVTIPAQQTHAFFTITAQDTIGTIQIQATANGYSAATVNMQVTAPKLVVQTTAQLNTTSPATAIYVYAADAQGTAHTVAEDLVVVLESSSAGVATIDSTTVVIRAGQPASTVAKWAPGTAGTATIAARDTRSAFYKYADGTVGVTVITPKAALSFTRTALGLGQYIDPSISVPDLRGTLTVPIAHSATPHTTTPATVTIPSNGYSASFRVAGASLGADTLTLSPAGHDPASGIVLVGRGHIDPLGGWPTTLAAGDSVQITLYARDSTQTVHYVSAPTTFTLAPNANVSFVSGGTNSVSIATVVIPADQQYAQFYLKGVTAGQGSATITSTDYITYVNTVTVNP